MKHTVKTFAQFIVPLFLASWLMAAGSAQESSTEVEYEVADEVISSEVEIQTERAQEILDAYTANAKGGSLYRKKKYDEALPHLLFAAKHGFKDSQARLGAIYLQGRGSTAEDKTKAVGWLGVAAHKPAKTEHIKFWRDFVKPLNAQQMVMVDKVVARFVEEYGPEATGMTCVEDFSSGSHIKKLICKFKDEEMLRDNGLLEQDIASLDVYNTIPGTGDAGAGGFGAGSGSGAIGGSSGGGGGGGRGNR